MNSNYFVESCGEFSARLLYIYAIIRGNEGDRRKSVPESIKQNMEGSRVEEERYLISDAARIVEVEAHVLRYWEEELELSIGRTELGHRYYTRENIETFQKVKDLKEKGLQLKAIKTILKGLEKAAIGLENERAAAGKEEAEEGKHQSKDRQMDEHQSERESSDKPSQEPDHDLQVVQENTEKLKHFETLVEDIVDRVVKENNETLEKHIEVTFSREMDYLVHMQEQREEERYRRLDESIRQHQNRQMVAAAKEGSWLQRLRKKKK